jgi:hypothetical protein
MNFIHYITAILMSLQPAYGDNESWEERTERMQIVAQAIDDASSRATCSEEYNTPDCKKTWQKDKKSLAILLVATGYGESHFAKNVHEGNCDEHECDAHKVKGVVYHRARSPWQIQRTGMVTATEYKQMNSATFASTKISANVAVRYLTSGMASCNTIHGALALYNGVRNCNWRGSKGRANFYENLMKKTVSQLENAAKKQRADLEARMRTKKKDVEDS